MRFQVVTTDEARDDIERLYEFNLARAATWEEMQRAVDTSERTWGAIQSLSDSAPRCRKAPDHPGLRELIIPHGGGYIALFRIEGDTVYVLAVRHQRESDYH